MPVVPTQAERDHHPGESRERERELGESKKRVVCFHFLSTVRLTDRRRASDLLTVLRRLPTRAARMLPLLPRAEAGQLQRLARRRAPRARA